VAAIKLSVENAQKEGKFEGNLLADSISLLDGWEIFKLHAD